MSAPIRLEPVTADMYGPLADFNADFENETRPAPYWVDRFRLWWEDNPAWRDGDMRGWTLMRQGRIVGFVGVFPAYFQLNGDETRAWISTTWRVQTAHRGQSLQLMRAVVSAAGQDLLFSTTAKQQIAPVMEALGYRRMPAAGGPHSVLVVNAARFSEVLLSARSGTMMARLIPSVVRRVHLGVFSLRSGSRLRVQPVYAADPAFDAFWQRTRQQYPNVTVRNAAWVDWQCFTSRSFAKDVVAAYDGPELCGFAIGVTLNTKSLRILDCVDMWYEFRRLNVAVALMRGLADVAVARNYDAVQMPHFSGPIEKALRGRGLLRVVRDPIVGYWRGSKTWMSGSNTDNTYLTTIEGDRFL